MIPEEGQELLLDQKVTIKKPTMAQVREWASTQRVFISSTMRDLAEDRQIAKSLIKHLGAEPRMYEDWVKDEESREAYIDEVRRCTIYLLLLGERYGTPDVSSGYSPTHQEYNEALNSGKPILALQNYSIPQSEKEPRLREWISELEANRVVTRYNNLAELKKKLSDGLKDFALERLAQWVKINHMIFHAQSIEDSGQDEYGKRNVVFKAKIGESRIVSTLNSYSRKSTYQRHRVTIGLESFEVDEIHVRKSSQAAGQIFYTIACESKPKRFGYSQKERHVIASYGIHGTATGRTYSHRERIEMEIRSIVFNEKPKDADPMLGLPEGQLQSIYEDWEDEQKYFPLVAKFYIIESLTGDKALVEAITRLEIGKVRQHKVNIIIHALPFLDFDRSGQPIMMKSVVDLTPQKRKPTAW